MYIYMYICVCVYVCVCGVWRVPYSSLVRGLLQSYSNFTPVRSEVAVAVVVAVVLVVLEPCSCQAKDSKYKDAKRMGAVKMGAVKVELK